MVQEVTPTQFQARRAAGALLLDVREDWELKTASVPDVVHIPMGQIRERLGELDPQRETVVICRSGRRSLEVARFLEQQGFRSVANLTGGILAWSRELDPSIPEY
ncbi:MAG TPA: rhodanese-like domain-containing protein [Steroidobacteraceae bacterium]|jgi:rhodanese-related sulfurtransferase|nr:rhodanese-like domain-containing protein [Steroidobacteraceae bacterium]